MISLHKRQQEKILTPAVLRLMRALESEGEARVVGGAARDAVMQRDIGDIDLATTLPPQRVMEILSAQKIKCVPTGLAHGTITAVVDHVGYEITTLRHDLETDGRHATVAFTDDWQADAARRDFTFNALYVDQAGQIYDYFNSMRDAANGYVRFIGDAAARIHEDVLRILRFFRFYALFGQGEPDPQAIESCRALTYLIPALSAERVAREILKLLAAPNPLPAWTLMMQCGVTQYIAPTAHDITRLENLLKNETRLKESGQSLTRLAALLPQDQTTAEKCAADLKFSNRDKETIVALSALPAILNKIPLRHALYLHGKALCRAALFLNGNAIADELKIIDAWENPVFPIKGQDIVKLGIPSGRLVGEILGATEDWWIAGDFRASRDDCLIQAKLYMKYP